MKNKPTIEGLFKIFPVPNERKKFIEEIKKAKKERKKELVAKLDKYYEKAVDSFKTLMEFGVLSEHQWYLIDQGRKKKLENLEYELKEEAEIEMDINSLKYLQEIMLCLRPVAALRNIKVYKANFSSTVGDPDTGYESSE